MPDPTKHEPTDKTRSEVSALASFGVPQEDIAAYIGVSHPTLRKYYPDELSFSSIKANAQVGKYLFSLASGQAIKNGATHGDCRTAAIFWSKTRMGWRETNHVDHTSSDGSMTPKGVPEDVLSALDAIAGKIASSDGAG
jgi:hypothetical protein